MGLSGANAMNYPPHRRLKTGESMGKCVSHVVCKNEGQIPILPNIRENWDLTPLMTPLIVVMHRSAI